MLEVAVVLLAVLPVIAYGSGLIGRQQLLSVGLVCWYLGLTVCVIFLEVLLNRRETRLLRNMQGENMEGCLLPLLRYTKVRCTWRSSPLLVRDELLFRIVNRALQANLESGAGFGEASTAELLRIAQRVSSLPGGEDETFIRYMELAFAAVSRTEASDSQRRILYRIARAKPSEWNIRDVPRRGASAILEGRRLGTDWNSGSG